MKDSVGRGRCPQIRTGVPSELLYSPKRLEVGTTQMLFFGGDLFTLLSPTLVRRPSVSSTI